MDTMWPRPLRTSEIRYPTTLPSLRATMNPSPTLSLNHAKVIRGYGSGKEAFSIAIIWSRSSFSKVPSLRSLNRVRPLGCGVRRFRQKWEDSGLELVRGRVGSKYHFIAGPWRGLRTKLRRGVQPIRYPSLNANDT